jgi:hypothetical protein
VLRKVSLLIPFLLFSSAFASLVPSTRVELFDDAGQGRELEYEGTEAKCLR